MRSFWSHHLAASFVSKDFYLLIFLGISCFLFCSRSISSFLSSSNDCERRVLLELFSCCTAAVENRELAYSSICREIIVQCYVARYLEWKRFSCCSEIANINHPFYIKIQRSTIMKKSIVKRWYSHRRYFFVIIYVKLEQMARERLLRTILAFLRHVDTYLCFCLPQGTSCSCPRSFS